ncbi:hypothetical protein [Streptosporangium canum]|uniref:hypothetical protein n=1 Tax=Streptosporangium canum TaxID=324952 RepID=UPI0011604CB5|nr:hypothetical protein [Streptosporangium canum]
MTPDELEQQLRTLLVEEGFAWILQQVDETIAAGKPEDVSVTKRRRSPRDQRSWEPRYPTDELSFEVRITETVTTPVAAESPRNFVQTNTYTAAERASLILQAIRSVLVDMPKAHKEQVALLTQGSAPLVTSVEFLQDENARGESATVIREGQPAPLLLDSEKVDQLVRALDEGLRQ